MKIIAIVNQKGGTAKTTTTAALGVLLGRQGMPVHLVDMDPQASLTRAFGQDDPMDRLYHSLTDRASLPVERLASNLTLSPSTIELSRAETDLLSEPGREYFLRTCLERTPLSEDTVVFLDCPPSLGILVVNCLATAGGLLTVVQPGGFELHALVHLQMTVRVIQERIQPDLLVLGAIITNAHRRRAITQQVAVEVGRVSPVLGIVRSDARLLYATTAGGILELRRSKALDDYARVAKRLSDEVL
jgi:chromosome partitioning protein